MIVSLITILASVIGALESDLLLAVVIWTRQVEDSLHVLDSRNVTVDGEHMLIVRVNLISHLLVNFAN